LDISAQEHLHHCYQVIVEALLKTVR